MAEPCFDPAYCHPAPTSSGPALTRPKHAGKNDPDAATRYFIACGSYWLQWQTPLGIAPAYAEQIERDLAAFYEDPLKRVFIETTCR